MEKKYSPFSGYLMVLIELVLLAAVIFSAMRGMVLPAVLMGSAFIFLAVGFLIINPNESSVLVLFGAYKGSVKDNGFYWINPLLSRKKISLRARNINSEPIKVNDKIGNPIMIGVVLVWRVQETFKAAFQVDNYEHFVDIQTEAAIRKLAGLYPYDNFEDHGAEVTLRSGGEEVNDQLEKELALDELSKKGIVQLDEEKKASMVSNLMVVLCGDKEATPIVNTGTIY